ncbi:MAG: energy transducer TonB [Cocleimonas sp.]
MLGFRSLIALILSLVVHGGIATYLLTQEKVEKKPKPKNITLQMAMFKQEPPKKVPVVLPKVVEAISKPIEPVIKPKVVKKIIQKKPKKKLVVKAKPKPKVAAKKVLKKRKLVKPRKVKPIKKKVVVQKPRKITPPKKKVVVRKVRKSPIPVRRITPPKRATAPAKRVAPRIVKPVRRPIVRRFVKQKPVQPPKQASKGNAQLERQYGSSIRQLIEQRKVYPRRAKRRKMQGVVKVAFSVNKSGVVSKLRIHQSSGSKLLDKSALEAVKKAGRFPALPAGINKQFLSYIIPIAYRLK